MTVTRIHFFGAAVLALCMLAAAQPAAAQQKAHFRPMTPHAHLAAHPAAKPHVTPEEREREKDTKAFRGVASRLSMTPEAMDDAFEAAHRANHRLTRGEFVMANVLAHDLGSQHANITTQAILDQLKNRNNMGRALRNLGLTNQQVKAAEKAADGEVKQANKAAKTASDRDHDRTPDTH